MPHPIAATAILLVSISATVCMLGCGDRTDTTAAKEDAVKRTIATAPKPASEISFRQEEPWYSLDASFRSMLDFDQAVTQTDPTSRAYRPTASYTAPKDWSRLVIDLYCSSDDRGPAEPASEKPGPLASLDAVQVFGADRGKPLAVFSRADLAVQRGTANSFEHDGRGPIIVTVERVRLPFAAFAPLIRDGHPYHLTVVGLDAQGRTMSCDDIEADEADEPIVPQPLPESGW